MTIERNNHPARPKVLVVDDDALVAMGLVTMLEDLGHEVVEANSGREALDILRRDTTIGLVVTDQSMPGMSGTDLAKAAIALRPTLPIILATGYREVPEGAELGLGRISKPYDEVEIARSISHVLANEPS